ncbi:formate dehydrogenase subunit gamma [Ammoniphilus sp. CFH 90114]|uniref:formate dehydrogenase subunit gamma n=1 Tax=Ammoniphilus sp. CFH 90114 TaxID=2493665 RepID=UPI0034CE0C0F
MMSTKNKGYVKRFSLTFRIAHWVNAGAFFALYITALPMYTEFFDWLYPVLGGPANARLLHRVFAVLFILPMFIMIFCDPKSFFHWIKSIFTWRKHDFGFFLPFAKEFFGKHADIPKQDFYNAGEKINSLLQVFTTIIIIASGFMMWFPSYIPYDIRVWGYLLHNIGFALAIAVVVGHVYLATLAPGAKDAMRGITKGDVSETWAKEHHGRWYDELKEEEKKKKQGA